MPAIEWLRVQHFHREVYARNWKYIWENNLHKQQKVALLASWDTELAQGKTLKGMIHVKSYLQ